MFKKIILSQVKTLTLGLDLNIYLLCLGLYLMCPGIKFQATAPMYWLNTYQTFKGNTKQLTYTNTMLLPALGS